MLTPSRKLVLPSLLAVLAFAGCGDDDGPEQPSVNHTVAEPKVRAYATGGRLGKVSRQQVFKELGATPVSTRLGLSRKDPKHPNRERVRFTCDRFKVKGGRKRDFAELCFRKDNNLLASVLINSPSGAAATGPLG